MCARISLWYSFIPGEHIAVEYLLNQSGKGDLFPAQEEEGIVMPVDTQLEVVHAEEHEVVDVTIPTISGEDPDSVISPQTQSQVGVNATNVNQLNFCSNL